MSVWMCTYDMSEYPRYGEARLGALTGEKHTELVMMRTVRQHYTD